MRQSFLYVFGYDDHGLKMNGLIMNQIIVIKDMKIRSVWVISLITDKRLDITNPIILSIINRPGEVQLGILVLSYLSNIHVIYSPRYSLPLRRPLDHSLLGSHNHLFMICL